MDVKDYIKAREADGRVQSLKLRVRLSQPVRAPSTIHESQHEGACPLHRGPGCRGREAERDGSHATSSICVGDATPPPPGAKMEAPAAAGGGARPVEPVDGRSRRAAEAESLRRDIAKLRGEHDALQQTNDQLRTSQANSGKALGAGATTGRPSAGLGAAHVLLLALLAALLGVLSRAMSGDAARTLLDNLIGSFTSRI